MRILTPADNAMFLAGKDIHICAEAFYFTDRVAQVQFFAGTNLLGLVTNSPSSWGLASDLFCFTWSNVTAGAYLLTAVATDLSGQSVLSPTVDITVVTNLPPRVRITKPYNGQDFLGPTNITICASAYDPDGTVVNVTFYEGTNKLGVVPTPPVVYVTNAYGVFPIHPQYCLTWSNVALGAYTLTAVATDNDGATTVSDPVTFNVVSNLPPRVRIEYPFYGEAFRAPVSIPVLAQANDPDGTIESVEFFENGLSLGVVTNPVVITNGWLVQNLYRVFWTNVSAGTYTLTAVATDNGGLSSTSAPVRITVYPPPPPSVTISYPKNGATIYNAPVNIQVCSVERNFTNPVVKVQFFAGTNSLGLTTNAPFSCILWSLAPPGAYNLTAVATDSHGASVTSPQVSITVTTNKPPIIGYW